MSDAVLIALITSISGIISGAIGLFFNWINKKHITKVADKVEEYKQEVNGNMAKLLETTKALGLKEGQAQEKSDQAARDKQ